MTLQLGMHLAAADLSFQTQCVTRPPDVSPLRRPPSGQRFSQELTASRGQVSFTLEAE